MLTDTEYKQLWDEIKGIKIAMMTSEDGTVLRSRPMYLVQDDFDGVLWFFSRRDSHKTVEFVRNPRVNLSFADIKKDCYVSISGSARILTDQAKVDELWNPMLDAWFPEGKDSPEVTLLAIEVKEAEIWDTKASKMRQLFEMVKAKVTDTRPDLGENRKIS